MHDLLGLSRLDAELREAVREPRRAQPSQAARRFADEVAHAKFPDPEHSYR